MARYQRDPVSELFDSGARVLLERAYAARGGWAGTRLADPSAEHAAYFGGLGIDVAGPDNAPTRGGTRNDAHTRWGRGFVRAVYYQHRWYSGPRAGGWRKSRRITARPAPLELEWGRRMPALGVIPAGRAVRVRVRRGGRAALRAAQQLPDSKRIYDAQGEPAGRQSLAELRDW